MITFLEASLVISKKDEIAARKLATMLVVDPFSTSKQDVGHRTIVKPNLQYLAILYRPFAQLENWLEVIFPEEQAESQFVDATYVENVLSEEYIPAIENYSMQELTRAFNSAEALLWHPIVEPNQTLAIGKGATSILMVPFMGKTCDFLVHFHIYRFDQSSCLRSPSNSRKSD